MIIFIHFCLLTVADLATVSEDILADENSDMIDVLTQIAYALPTIPRKKPAQDASRES